MSNKKNNLILEFSEFNLQRFNSDASPMAMHVDNPQLSTNAFDKHQSSIRQAMARVNDIFYNIKGTTSFSKLRSELSLDYQDINNLIIQKIVKSNGFKYDVYIKLYMNENEYWGKIEDILGFNTKLTSELFRDYNLLQPKEWVIKIKGIIIKAIKEWLKPKPGNYKLIKDQVICYSMDIGNRLVIEKGTEVELIRSYDDKLVIRYKEDDYKLVDDNLIYFNWWFLKINGNDEN